MEFCHADSRALRTNRYRPENSNNTNSRKLERIIATNYTQSRVASWVWNNFPVFFFISRLNCKIFEKEANRCGEMICVRWISSPESFQVNVRMIYWSIPDSNVCAYVSSRHSSGLCSSRGFNMWSSVAYAAVQQHEQGTFRNYGEEWWEIIKTFLFSCSEIYFHIQLLLLKGGEGKVAEWGKNTNFITCLDIFFFFSYGLRRRIEG